MAGRKMHRAPIVGVLRLAVVAGAMLCAPAARADIPGPQHKFPITREGDAGLPEHTIFRPTDLTSPQFKLPIVAWANGGCRRSNEEFRYFLMSFSAMGYFVVANGAPENPFVPSETAGLANPQPHQLIDAVDWAVKQNASPSSRFYNRIDDRRIVVMGQSCGGGEAVTASADPRVDATIAWNQYLGDPSGVHAPILFVSGADQDFTYPMTLANYQRSAVPAVSASNPAVGHTNMWDDPADGSPPPGPLQNEPLVIAPKWLDFMLYGRESGRAYFLGEVCGLCSRPGWTVESKDWDGFTTPPANEAPLADSAGAAQPPAPTAKARKCPATRRVTLRARHGVARGVVYVHGRRRATVRPGRPARLHVSARRRVAIKIVERTSDGRRRVRVLRTRACR